MKSEVIVPVTAVALRRSFTTSTPALRSQPFCPESAFRTLFPPMRTLSNLGDCSESSVPMWIFSRTCGYWFELTPARLKGKEIFENPGTWAPEFASRSDPLIHPPSFT